MNFETFFHSGSGGETPYPFQVSLAEGSWPETLVVPTGFGKTAAVLAAWLWKNAHPGDQGTPRRLIYCLPMRTLVEQTEEIAKSWIVAACNELKLNVQLGILMGGRNEKRRRMPDWLLRPDCPTILIGTQDLLVSAALMRGYGVNRYRWPVDFALLHNDALWVFDEVQLTGATLATSAQLEAFRRKFKTGMSSRTLWMSATLDPCWLKTVDFVPTDNRRSHDLSDNDIKRARSKWEARKTLHPCLNLDNVKTKKYATDLANEARKRARPGTNTILFLNIVVRAQAVFKELGKMDDGPELLLVHSRFRAAERKNLMKRLQVDPSAKGRIVVATQALEAGVNVTSSVLITEIAPWSSLVQRFGRCNRYGECSVEADVYWIDLPNEYADPYKADELDKARSNLRKLTECGPSNLVNIEQSAPPRGHVIRKRDLFDLFDTDPDLSGFDVDVSLYVRDTDDTDVRLFWRPIEHDKQPPDNALAHSRDEVCPVPIGGAKKFIKRKCVRAWLWDTLAKNWRRIGKPDDDIFPGLVIWVASESGGYDPKRGFDASETKKVEPAPAPDAQEEGMDDDPNSYSNVSVSLAKHSVHVRDEALELAQTLGLSEIERDLITKVALWHDLGKAHDAFVALTGDTLPLAKWPTEKTNSRQKSERKFFRHELASALAYLANHDWSEDENIAAYLIAAHHGKVRMRLSALPKEKRPKGDRLFARGVWDGDMLPATRLGDFIVPETKMNLDLMQLGEGACGPSWSERTQMLLKKHGPFRLAWLEALVRIADWRASKAEEDANHDDL